jgi:hypothetical protein
MSKADVATGTDSEVVVIVSAIARNSLEHRPSPRPLAEALCRTVGPHPLR